MKFKNVYIILIILLMILSVFFSGCTLLISSYNKVHFTPRNIGLEFENVTLINKQKNRLKGWFIKAKDGAPCIIFCEGNGQNRSYYLRFVRFLYEAGYNVFLFDYNGFGDSEGKSSEIEFNRFTEDVELALDYIKNRKDIDKKRIALFGWSMGGGLALYTAARRSDVKAVVVDSSMYSFLDRFSFAVKEKFGKIFSIPIIALAKLFYSGYDPIESIKKLKDTPVLFMHGSDDIISYKEIVRLCEAYNGPKRLIIFPFAGHMENHLYYKDEYSAQVLNFLNIYLKEKIFNDYTYSWEYTKEGKALITIKNFTSDLLPIELRINATPDEYVKNIMVPNGTHKIEQKTPLKPTSVIVSRFYKNVKITSNGWHLFSSDLSKLSFNFDQVIRGENLLPYARLATDPDSPLLYAEAVVKNNNVLFNKNKRYLVSSIITANMMSPKTAFIAEKLYSLKQNELIDNLQLFNTKMIGHPQILEALQRLPNGDPWGEKWDDESVEKEQTIDGMYAMQKITGKITGKSASIAFINIALLRMMGIQPDNVFAVHIKSSPGHTITCFSTDNEFYIFNNNLLLPGESIALPKKDIQISGIYNDAFYLSSYMETNFRDRDIEHIKSFMENIFRNLSWNELRTKKVESGDPIIFSSSKFGRIPAGETTNKIQKEVFKRSMEFPISQYTYAKYAFQSLLVKNPEVYALAAKNNYYVKKLVSELKTKENIINWMKNNLKLESIFNDDLRIMQPDEVIVYKQGNGLDQALLLWSFMDTLHIKAWVIMTEKESYLVYEKDSLFFIRMKNFETFSNLKNEKIVLIFNDSESYFSWLDVNKLNSKIAEIIY
ncbi:alpha/beta fold hydrolase [Candidatus Poribacteria bacterium]|nr:alpha/beta fold hydrolase [Candidatus Poribacteria bacterium]